MKHKMTMKILSAALALTAACPVFACAADRRGDLNGDGKINAADARIALRIAAHIQPATAEQLLRGDVNRDGSLNSADARILLRAAAKIKNAGIDDARYDEYLLAGSDAAYRAILSEKSFDTLLAEINAWGDTEDWPDAYYAEALCKKIGDISTARYLEEVWNPKNVYFARACLLELSEYILSEADYDALKPMLWDDATPTDLKIDALIEISIHTSDLDVLERAARGADEELAFQAIRFLYNASPARAMPIVEEILASFDGSMQSVSEKLRIAVMTKGREIGARGTAEEKEAFLALCRRILDLPGAQDEDLLTTSVTLAIRYAEGTDE